MFQTIRKIMLCGALVVLGMSGATVRAGEDAVFLHAKQAFDAIGKKTSDAPDSRPETLPAAMTSPAAADPVKAVGKTDPAPATVSDPAAAAPCPQSCKSCDAGCGKPKAEKCHCCQAIGHWFCFIDPTSHGECCGFTPRSYHPPLTAWFPCPAAPLCATPGSCADQCGIPAARRHFDNLPAPVMPKMVQTEKPIVPGSSTAMADKPITPAAPASYKSLPVVPEPPTPLVPSIR